MSSEESYLAILRYLTNEREPYAPGTEGNAKRKIRKAAACYVVRSGTLYYQRRQRDKEGFSELEVVLQPGRRKGLIETAHIGAGGEHLTRHQTWHLLSQKYWWRGILKQMKDYIKECSKCQERLDRSHSLNDPSEMLEELGIEIRSDGNETDSESSNPARNLNPGPKPKKKVVAKHELVFVDSKGIVKQSSAKHGQTVLEQLNQQRLSNQFCDVTLLIEGEEYKAHKSVLAASSEYFRELFIEKGAVSSHEAFVDLSGFCKSSFLPLLEFAYTSELSFDFSSMAEVAMLAKHLFMHEVLEICESVHKQMESKQLTLYQKGDVTTVTSEKNTLFASVEVHQDNDSPLLAETRSSHQMSVVSKECGQCESAETTQTQTEPTSSTNSNLSSSPVESTVQLVSRQDIPISSLTDTTTIYISDVSSEIQPTVIIPTVIDVANLHPEPKQTLCINSEACKSAEHTESLPPSVCNDDVNDINDTETVQTLPFISSEVKLSGDQTQSKEASLEDSTSSTNVDPQSSITSTADSPSFAIALETSVAEDVEVENMETEKTAKSQEVPKRKRGRPRKSQTMNEKSSKTSAVETQESFDESSYKTKLRERLVEEGGYIQMHKGQEKKLQKRKLNPKSAVQQAALKLVQRGKKKRVLPPKNETKAGDTELECNECGKVFHRRYALIMHSLKHSAMHNLKQSTMYSLKNEKTKEFQCPLCTKEFQYSASLRAHLIRHSKTGKTDVNVVETEESYTTKGITKRQFICGLCGRTLPKLYSLRIHMLKHTGVKPHACEVCGKTFTHKHGLKMHKALHESQKQYKCDMCDKSFVTNRSLQEHVSTHTGESKYLCSVCGKAFHRASGLSKHLKKHKPSTDTRGYHCTQCERSFFELRDLQQHMNKHLGVKPFECEFCGKSYSWKKDWYSHVKSHSVTEPYRCSVCGKEFFEKSLYRRHVNKATHGKKGRKNKNVERACEHCGKVFTQLREYRRHVNNHEGVKPFECLTCGVAWADARSLKRHVRTHTGERPYVCPVCNEAYIDARNLRKHMTKYHKDYVPCKIMLEKDTLQFHNQGTQVEHAFSYEPHTEIVTEEIETVLISEDNPSNPKDGTAVSTLSDQSIMQVVNYVLAQQQGQKVTEVAEHEETVEMEVGHVSEVA
ncbi:zinc finger and BTB domain-containing protein 11 [Rhinophrynus dorsalis]